MVASGIEQPTNWQSRWADWARYPRLYSCFVRYCLVREMSFRFNFFARVITGAAWLGFIVFYFQLIFANTKEIGDWTRDEYLFLMGTWFIISEVVELFFLENCTRFSELIRTGNLDFALLKPIDEQFLVSCERLDLAEIPNLFVGTGLLVYSTMMTHHPMTLGIISAYILMIVASVAILYSFMIMLASLSVWIVRSQSLHEMWFYLIQFSRYPWEIYQGNALGLFIRITLTYVVPIMLAINVPSRYGAKVIEWQFIAYLFLAAGVLLIVSRRFFKYALNSYRSASS